MKSIMNEVEINGVVYVPKGTETTSVISTDGMELVIVRTQSAGVHYGYLFSRDGSEVKLRNTRRMYYWDGAATLSQLALDGVTKPENCKFTVALPEITVLGVIEVIPVSSKAKAIIDGVKTWKQ